MSRYSVVHSSSLFRSMVYLAAPVLVEEMLTLMVGWTDWWLTGHFLEDASPKAAMSLMAYMLWLIPSMFSAIAIGATAMVSRFIGGGDSRFANHCANQAVTLGLMLAAVATLLIYFYHVQFIKLMNLPGDASGYAVQYIRVITWVIPLIMIEQVAAACLRGAGDSVSGLVAKTVVNIINIVVSTGLITGWGPFPNMGFVGLAIGTAAGHAVGGLILLTVLVVGRAGLRLSLADLKPDGHVIRRLLKVGLPGGADIGAILICQFIFVRIVYQLGVIPAAAHGLAIEIEAMAYLPGTAFQVAAATMSGQFLGAGDPRRAVRSVFLCCASSGVVMTTAAFVMFFGGGVLTHFFTGDSDPETARVATELLKIIAVGIPSLSLAQVISGALRGAGDTRWPLAITLIGFLAVRIPLAIVLSAAAREFNILEWPFIGFGYGVHGAWYAMVADILVRSLLLIARLLHGGWLRTRV